MFNTKVTVMSLMDLSHVVTEHSEVTEGWCFITDIAAVLQQILIGLLDLITTETNLELSLKMSISEHPVSQLLVWQNGIRKDHLQK